MYLTDHAPTRPGKSNAASGLSRDADASATRQLRRRTREHAEDFANMLLESALQVWTLQRVVAKKRDPKTHEFFLDAILRVQQEEDETEDERGSGRGDGNESSKRRGGGSMNPQQQQKQQQQEEKGQKEEEHYSNPLAKQRQQKKRAAELPFTEYWRRMVAALATVLGGHFGEGGTHARDAHAVNAVLVELYPALRKALLSLVDRLRESTGSAVDIGGEGRALSLGRGIGGVQDSSDFFLWGDAPFASAKGSDSVLMRDGGGWSASEDLMGRVMAMRATNDESESSSPLSSLSSPTSSLSDIRIGGSSELFRHHRRSGLLDETLLRTISGASAPSPMTIFKQQQLLQERSSPTALVSSVQEEQVALLAALGPIQERFLAHSMEVIMKPVEQMFPSVEGYANAVSAPGKVCDLCLVVLLFPSM
jgi:hypothetical protein